MPDGPVIVYLPGVARSELRAVDSCKPELAPIAELQYRSHWFSHPNNRDWTVRALLTNRERGLGLGFFYLTEFASWSTYVLMYVPMTGAGSLWPVPCRPCTRNTSQ